MSKKTKTTNNVAYSTPPPTQEVTNLQNMVNESGDYATPIRSAYARAGEANRRSYANPLGAYTTADVRDKSMRSQSNDLYQQMGIDLGNAAQQSADARFGRQATVAGFTRPQMYNAGGTSTTSDPFGNVMQIGSLGASLGSAALL